MHAVLRVRTLWGGHSYVLRPGHQFVVGRDPGASVRLRESTVSRQHARFEWTAEGPMVVDLESRNGTFLEDRQLSAGVAHPLINGCTVLLGRQAVEVAVSGYDPADQEVLKLEACEIAKILPGDTYELLGEIGQGALGRIWAARERATDRVVAVKLLHAGVESESEVHQRFLREGDTSSRLESPYVVQLLRDGTSAERPYLILELVHGPTAYERLQQEGQFPIPTALWIAEHVARGLAAMEVQGLVHRDVKPHNVLLTQEGSAKLSDFGIAKVVGGGSLTRAGSALGTLPYLAPEQAVDATSVDARCDLYGLGATIYHLIAGKAPLFGDESPTDLDLVKVIREEEPQPLRTFQPNCPREVADYVHRLLSKDPADRPGPAAEVAEQFLEMRNRLFGEETEVDLELTRRIPREEFPPQPTVVPLG